MGLGWADEGAGGSAALIVTGYNEFVAHPGVSSAGGVHTVNDVLSFEGTITWPAGERVVYGETGVMASVSWQAAYLVFDVDGPAISGPVVINMLAIVNTNTGALSWCMEASSSLGRTVSVLSTGFDGIRGGRFVNVLGALTSVASAAVSGTSVLGWEFSGVIGAGAITRPASLVGTVSQVALRLDSSLVITSLLAFQSMASTLTLPTQSTISISDAVVLAPGAALHLSGCSHNGPQDRMFAQGPGLMSVDDLRLVAKGNPSAPDWTASATATRLDTVNPVQVILPAVPSDPVPIPYADGVTAIEVEASTTIRFSLFKDPTDVNRWWLEYAGPIPRARGTAGWAVLMKRVGGGSSDITICSELNKSELVQSVQQDDGGVFTDFTTDAQSEATDDVPLLPATISVSDSTYLGSDPSKPTGPEIFKIAVSQAGVGTFTFVWEYWNGAWVPAVGVVDGTVGFTASPGVYDVLHEPQLDWVSTTVNAVSAFYLRARLTVATSLATQPRASQVFGYIGFSVVESTILPAQSSAAKQSLVTGGDVEFSPGDRIRPAIRNIETAHTIDIYDVTQRARVFP